MRRLTRRHEMPNIFRLGVIRNFAREEYFWLCQGPELVEQFGLFMDAGSRAYKNLGNVGKLHYKFDEVSTFLCKQGAGRPNATESIDHKN